MSGVDDTWHATPVTLTLSATDVTSGVAKTEYRIDSGAWTVGVSLTLQADGDHVVGYRSVDVAGNVEASQTVHVKIDTTAPVTTQSGADAAWHNLDVTITLTATDASGVRETTYSTDGGLAWTVDTSLIVRAPADHSNDGMRPILYHSVDIAGNIETHKSCAVRIDTASRSLLPPPPPRSGAAPGRQHCTTGWTTSSPGRGE